MSDYDNYRRKIMKLEEPRQHRITRSLGVYDAYKYIRKKKWMDIGRPVKEHEFYQIIRRVNDQLANILVFGGDVTFPHRMGRIELRKYPTRVSIVDGKLVTNLPVDWDATLKLWYEDPQAQESKQLVYIPEKEQYIVFYNRNIADYTNKSFYQFSPNRNIKTRLKYNIKMGNIDAFSIND